MKRYVGGRRSRLLLATLAVFAAAAGAAYATGSSDSGAVYTACKLNATGTIRLIDPTAPASSLLSHCTTLETQFTFSQKGVKGDPGTPGAAGANGADGATGPQGPAGAAGMSVLATQLAAAADLNCVFGGTRFTAFNGVTYACNGAPGSQGEPGMPGAAGATGAQGPQGPAGADGTSLLTSSEPAGSNCAYGGVKVSSASGASFVCNGAPGAQGEQGPQGATGPQGAAGSGGFVGSDCTVPPNDTAGTVQMVVAAGGAISFICHTETPVSACPTPLPSYPNASTVCNPATGALSITCASGFADGDNDIANGCEINTQTSVTNCGAVGNVVSAPHATIGCVNGHGVIVACQAGFFDLNGQFADGCEAQDIDTWATSFAAVSVTSSLNCGGTVSMTGNSADEDWLAISVNEGFCTGVTFNLSGANMVYDVIPNGSFPPATGSNTALVGPHTFPLSAGRYTVRVYRTTPGLSSWTFTASE